MPGNENNLGPFMVEGIGQPNFRPRSIDIQMFSDWVKIPDRESFYLARRIIKEEGIMIGGSAGAAIYGCIQYCLKNNLGADKRCIVICPDSIRSYISTFITDSWMIDFKYMKPQPNIISGYTLHDCIEALPHLKDRVSVPLGTSIKDAIQIILNSNQDSAGILDNQNNVKGGITLKDLSFRLGSNRAKLTDAVDQVMNLRFRKVSVQDPMDYITHSAETNYYVIVQEHPNITITPNDITHFMSLVN